MSSTRRSGLILQEQERTARHYPIRRDRSMFPSDDSIIRLILLGKTGTGKSSLGNLLLGCLDGEEQFTADNDSQSVTTMCAVGRSTFDGKSLVVVDTPGFIDTNSKTELEKKQLAKEITKSIQKTLPGPQAFFIVMKLCRFTLEEQQAIKEIKEIFGPNLLNFCVVIFTEKDSLDRSKKTIEQWVAKAGTELKELLELCDQRYIAVNNIEVDQLKQEQMRQEVLQMVMKVMEKNKNAVFTSELLEKINKVIKINKEGMGRCRGINIRSSPVSTATANANVAVIEIVQDDELIPEAQAIVEEKVFDVLKG